MNERPAAPIPHKPMEKVEVLTGDGRLRATSCVKFYEEAPQETLANGTKTWIARSANMVVAYSEAVPGIVFTSKDQADESMVLLPPGIGAVVEAGGAKIESKGGSLFIVPPGPSTITVTGKGPVIRIYSNLAEDLAAKASNAAIYADGAPEVAPIVPWPDPVGGFKLRHYDIFALKGAASWGKLIRSTNLMINLFEPKTKPKDPTLLSPHSHDDFEQLSLGLQGNFIHHLRVPWSRDSTQWRNDEHLLVGSPGVTVMPAKVIHTSQNVGEGTTWLVDIFGPPRIDFSLRKDFVRNADEYPMPPGVDLNQPVAAEG